ncbi:Uncharacterised protein [Serratia quinivorans]|uniref:fimbrial protein n=1 Tax=Serratia quinivorans TaxID=137545 RepID=UPI00217AA187|nr:fimbrial protein [Serratia quinivorans]CAI0731289.1 Uncharacterised protein [Serratia quinivorans]CAI0753621.1 Uncharacterised protein [Serratia quinivorans]CAI1544618.1 Uncharacterised protein [Serratia quinivorans]CAI2044739.1 Uncharacterised protein [Serratia quinivorans]CAI2409238.1 Uncharacterised protein [Serratia quinivorans]
MVLRNNYGAWRWAGVAIVLLVAALWGGRSWAGYTGYDYTCKGALGATGALQGCISGGPWGTLVNGVWTTTKTTVGMFLAYHPDGGNILGYVPPEVTTLTVGLFACSGSAGPGGALCPRGVEGRLVAKGGTWQCTAGEPWVDCIARSTGPYLVEGVFLTGESSACIEYQDQNGRWWGHKTTWGLCGTAHEPPTSPDHCMVMSQSDWDISFGNVERMDIPTSGGTEQTKALKLSCLGTKAHDFSVKLNMTPTSWSTTQLVTTNPDLGIAVSVGGTAAKLGESFKMKVTGSGSKTLGFSVLRNPKTKALDVATGDFTASGTLVVSED